MRLPRSATSSLACGTRTRCSTAGERPDARSDRKGGVYEPAVGRTGVKWVNPPSTRRREPRPLSRSEQIADAWVNAPAIAAGLVGVAVLMAIAPPQENPALTFSLLTYSGGLLTMLISSALYNGGAASKHKDLLRRIDHAAILCPGFGGGMVEIGLVPRTTTMRAA